MKQSRFTEKQIIGILKEHETGISVADLCRKHGLRKAAAARLVELGCTEFVIMAITGHQTSKEVTRYTKAARQKTRAASAFVKLTAARN